MKRITCLIYGGFSEYEAQWTRCAINSFLANGAGDLLVIDNTAVGDPLDTVPWMRAKERVIVTPSPFDPWRDGRRRHGDGYHAGLKWCRENGYDLMVSYEGDCETLSAEWQDDLARPCEDDGMWMVGGMKCGYGPVHHIPTCYLVNLDWPDFNQGTPKGDDLLHPRYEELFDNEAIKISVRGWAQDEKNYNDSLNWFQSFWDVGQKPWFWAACRDKAQHVVTSGVKHFWQGTRKPVLEGVAKRWLH